MHLDLDRNLAKRVIAAALMVVLGVSVGASGQQVPAPAANQAPTLADIARQKRAEKAKKVYSSEDLKAAEVAAPAAEAPAAAGAAPAGSVQSNEAMAAAQAKLDDLKGREAFYLRSVTRFETSAKEAEAAGEEGKQRIMTEATEEARAELVKVADERAKAEQELEKLKAVQAAAAAAAAKRKPARKAAPAPKS
jgi:hypothetical protein